MTTDRAPSAAALRWRPVGAAAVALLVASVLTLALVVEARPARLVSATPADGARLAAPPARIGLTFTARPDPARSHVTVGPADGPSTGSADGAPARAGGLTVTDRRVSVPVTVVGDAEYRVAYHVVFADGRAVSGMLRFAVGPGEAWADPAPADAGAGAGAGAHGHGDVGAGTLLVTSGVAVTLAVVALLLLRRPGPTRVRRRRLAKVGR